MIHKKSRDEIKRMCQAGHIVSLVHQKMKEVIEPGISTKELDNIAMQIIKENRASPTFLGYHGFPGCICASINEQVVHGIPSEKVILKEGDIVSLDAGLIYKGYHSDAARTHFVGQVSPEVKKLVEETKNSFFEGIKMAKAGNHLYDISNAIDAYISQFGYGIVRDLVGHGIGSELHEDPQIPNFRQSRRGLKLQPGMTLAIEPMINMGRADVDWMDDDWTVVAQDRLPSAHYENTILITDGEPEILTML